MTTLLEHLGSGTVSQEIQDLKLTPPEDDPNYLFSEERIKQNNTAQNAVKYGWYGGVSDFFHYLQAIPGAINEVNDIIVSKTGVGEPSEGTVLESIEEYFKKVSAYYDPVRRGHTPPLGKKNKILAGFSSLPGVFAQYVPTTRVLGSLPLGFAVTDSIKAGYDGTMHDVPWAFAKGYMMGGVVKLASGWNMPARIAALSALGYGVTPKGTDGNTDDKIAAAVVWGGLGGVPKIAWGKRALPDQIKQEAAEVDVRFPVNETLLKKHSDLVVELDKQYVVYERLNTKPNKTEKDNINLDTIRSQIKDKEQAIDSLEEALWFDVKISSKIAANEATNIEPEAARLDYFNKDGSPKYTDLNKNQFKFTFSNLFRKDKPVFTLGANFKAHFFPLYFVAKQFAKTNPLMKRVASELRRNRIITDVAEESILHSPIFNSAKLFRRSKLEGETTEQFNKRVPFSRAKYGLILTAMRHGIQQPSMRGSLTALEGLYRTNTKSAFKVIDAFVSAHDFKLKHAEATLIKNGKKVTPQTIGKEYLKRNKDKTLAYQISSKELKSNFKLNAEEIYAFERLQWGLREVRRMNNDRNNQMGEYNKLIPELPNYFPHIWIGNYRIGVNKVTTNKATGEESSKFIKAYHTDSAMESGRARKMFEKEYKELDTETDTEIIKYNVKEIPPELGQRTGKELDVNLDVFADSIKFLEKSGRMDEAVLLANTHNILAAKKGFSKHTLQRKNIEGWLGSAEALVTEGVITKGFNIVLGSRTQSRQIKDFLRAYQSYIRGGVRHATNSELDVRIRRFIEGPTEHSNLSRYYPRWVQLAKTAINSATGRSSGEVGSVWIDKATATIIKGITGGKITLTQRTLLESLGSLNRITLAMKLLFGQGRYLTASGIQPDQMIPAKLVELAGFSEKSNTLVWKSYSQAMYDLFNPSKEIVIPLIQYGGKQRVLSPAFIKEFAPDTLVTSLKPVDIGGKIILDPNKLFDTLSLKDLATSFEQVSRLRALLMFNRVLLNSTKNGKPMYTVEQARVLAARYADAYMVEYNRTERPWMYTRMGAIGKTAGLFKTFTHNWLAQLYEHSYNAKVYHNNAPLATFLYLNLLVAGAMNFVAKDEIDWAIDKMQPILKKFNKGKAVPNISQMLLEDDRDDWFNFGVLSTILDADITPTVKPPSFKINDLLSFPALDVLGVDPVGFLSDDATFFKNKGIIPSSFNLAWRTISETATISEWIEFHKSYAPTSLHGFIEAYYSGRDINNILFEIINDKFGTDLPFSKFPTAYPQLKNFPVRNTSKNIGIIYRSDKEWMKRYFSTRSLREAKMLKIVSILTRVKRSAAFDKIALSNIYAQFMILDEVPPSWILEAYEAIGGNIVELQTQAHGRVKKLNTPYSETAYFDMMEREYPDLYQGLIKKLEELYYSDLERK